jgi:hypothetical protein
MRNQVQSIHVGKAKINDEGIVNAFQGHCFPTFCVVSSIDLVSGLYQSSFQELLNGDVIFY